MLMQLLNRESKCVNSWDSNSGGPPRRSSDPANGSASQGITPHLVSVQTVENRRGDRGLNIMKKDLQENNKTGQNAFLSIDRCGRTQILMHQGILSPKQVHLVTNKTAHNVGWIVPSEKMAGSSRADSCLRSAFRLSSLNVVKFPKFCDPKHPKVSGLWLNAPVIWCFDNGTDNQRGTNQGYL